jgi:hypothetical protein
MSKRAVCACGIKSAFGWVGSSDAGSGGMADVDRLAGVLFGGVHSIIWICLGSFTLFARDIVTRTNLDPDTVSLALGQMVALQIIECDTGLMRYRRNTKINAAYIKNVLGNACDRPHYDRPKPPGAYTN